MAGRYNIFRKDQCARLTPRVVNEDVGAVFEAQKEKFERIKALVQRVKERRNGQEASKES